MRFPKIVTGKGAAEQRIAHYHGLIKQHIQSFRATGYAFLYIVWHPIDSHFKALAPPNTSVLFTGYEFDKTNLR